MNFTKTLLASAALLASLGANAAVTSSLGGSTSNFLSLSSTSLDGVGTIVGGKVYNSDMTFASLPEGTTIYEGKFLAAGILAGEPATIAFTAPVSYISFLWGSPDIENLLTVTTSSGSAQNFSASGLNFAVTDGTQSFSQYVQFKADAGSTITSLTFANVPARDAFEVANFSVTAPVPEPETYALMFAGLGVMGFVMRRRSNKAL